MIGVEDITTATLLTTGLAQKSGLMLVETRETTGTFLFGYLAWGTLRFFHEDGHTHIYIYIHRYIYMYIYKYIYIYGRHGLNDKDLTVTLQDMMLSKSGKWNYSKFI